MKKLKLTIFISFLFYALSGTSQNLIKFDENFILRDGVYLSIEEFRRQQPSITNFKIISDGRIGSEIRLQTLCLDTATGNTKTCLIENCWGFVNNNKLYISQNVEGGFFRIHILGSLIHFFDLQTRFVTSHDPRFYNPYSFSPYVTQRRTEQIEYIIVFETGERILFNYRNFSEYLAKNDNELYQELRQSRQRRKMIYHFMLRYNAKHPIFFPVY